MKKSDKQWQPWIRKVNNHELRSTLLRTPKDMRSLVAAALSVAKWHPTRLVRGGSDSCGLCVFWSQADCGKCPLVKRRQRCRNKTSTFSKWFKALKLTFEVTTELDVAADEMYELLMDIYREEYEKVMSGE